MRKPAELPYNFWKEYVKIKIVETIWRSFQDAILEKQVQTPQLRSKISTSPDQKQHG